MMLTSRTLIRTGLATALVFGSIVGFSTTANAAVPQDTLYVPVVKITAVSAFYATYGTWQSCASTVAAKVVQTIKCEKTVAISNSITGTVSAPIKAIDVSVSFTHSATTTKTISDQYPVPKGKSSEIEFRKQYKTKKVTQKIYSCIAENHSVCYYKTTAYAYAHKANGVNIRVVVK
jgi:hypothetical protein